jgi:hypothetical protein
LQQRRIVRRVHLGVYRVEKSPPLLASAICTTQEIQRMAVVKTRELRQSSVISFGYPITKQSIKV